ncbi:cation acetate symporter [Nonomuraea sp. KC401]|uniref:solute symporter family protein n=1 Tax=unclassified Nonomuraea TaxID=2593643 RepID=UPI0010FD530A|nr:MULTISPECIES: cation acetate symporter [unclassified Nonomuraea]NBE98052.1 sodium/solute symporter [Nonomuraea sp. K271]TLF61769.1 cation acetate symporter [Nonomuraea sp. KC401]
MILFLTFVAATLGITVWASRQTKTAADYYAGGRSFSGAQNGLAIGGDYMSAASFLGIAGIIALSGYDGFLYSIGFLVAWLVALLLVAELMRNSGKFTMADVLAFRMSPRPVRTAAGASTIVVSIFYLLAQMVGAGALVGLLLGIESEAGKLWTIVGVGALMIVYVVFGGMKGTTWVQIVKAVLLMTGAALVTVLVLSKFGFNLSALLSQAAATSGPSGNTGSFLVPGLKYGTEAQGIAGKIDLISLGLALVLGTAGLPHILIRFYTVPTAKDARKSVLWGIGIIGVFYLLTLVLGFGAAALVGREEIVAGDPGGNTAAPLLALRIGEEIFGPVGGTILLAFIGAVAFATILAVVAGLTLASSSSFAHDLYAHVFRRGQASERQEVVVARISALVIGAIAIGLSILAQSQNVAFLVALAFAVAASGNLPAILYSLFWKRFNTSGAVSAIYGGLLSALLLVIFSPVVSGSEAALFKDADFAWFPLSNPGILSIPIGFLCGWIGTIMSKEYNAAKYAEIEVRSLTGVGSEKAVKH